jgi:hypothetical protein
VVSGTPGGGEWPKEYSKKSKARRGINLEEIYE